MKRFAIISVCLTAIICTGLVTLPKQPELVGIELPRPFRPRPNPQPTPAPLEESDGRLLDRLRGHITQIAEERASRRVEAALQEVADKLEATNAQGEVILASDEPSQFIGTSLIVGALVAAVKRICLLILNTIIVGVIVALFWKYSAVIIPVFVGSVTAIAVPAAWAAGKKASLSRQEVEAIVQLRLGQKE